VAQRDNPGQARVTPSGVAGSAAGCSRLCRASAQGPHPRLTAVTTGQPMSEGDRMDILVIDVGGTHVKVGLSAHPDEKRKFASGREMTPQAMLAGVNSLVQDWTCDVISLGYPGAVIAGKPLHDPHNLGAGWVGFDYAGAFARPVRIINDAAMQALGNYRGGKMLFLGLGTGLGSAMIVDGIVEAMELAHLPYKKGRSFEDYVGIRGLERRGRKRWSKTVFDVVQRLQTALEPDDVVLGGGNAKRLKTLPPGTRRGDDRAAFTGGFRLWQPDDTPEA
jgi:polyphosphate glucokinase